MQKTQRRPPTRKRNADVRLPDGRTGRVPRGARRLALPEGEFRFLVGKVFVQVWEPNGRKHLVNFSEITGLPWAVIERGHDKRTSDAAILPLHVKLYIERGFTPALSPIDVN